MADPTFYTPHNSNLKAKIIPVEEFDLIVFGGTGDLSMRKLMPSLYYRFKDQQIPQNSRIIGVSRSKMSRSDFVKIVKKNVRLRVNKGDFDQQVWEQFAQSLYLVSAEATQTRGWDTLTAEVNKKHQNIRVFYLSVPPGLFSPICQRLKDCGLVSPTTRLVIEKPIGTDLKTAIEINEGTGAVFQEKQIYRIDHYLGKETVQNLMALRFANSLFEPLWNRQWVDHIQITVAESIGIGQRGAYYDHSGALRDMVQNHLLQMLCLVAMEPPKTFAADAVRDEKLKVLHALRSIGKEDIKNKLVFGQYKKGAVEGEPVVGYREEKSVDPHSVTETFVALKAEVDNWRWADVPFYLRTGKRMPERKSEIVIQFRDVPHLVFPQNKDQIAPNRLVIRLQPDEGMTLFLMAKVPGPGGFRMQPVPLNLNFADTFKTRYPDGYERLVMDVVRGNPTLFMRRDEVEAAWRWLDPILESWENTPARPHSYTSGAWGPSAAIAMIERDGRTWYGEGE